MFDRFLRNFKPKSIRSTTLHRTISPSKFPRIQSTALINDPLEQQELKYSRLLQRSGETNSLDLSTSIHANLIKQSLLSSLFLHNHLLISYFKCADTDEALKAFEEIPIKNVVSWTAAVAGLAQRGLAGKSIALFRSMRRSSVPPNEFTLVSALNACALSENSFEASQVYALVVRYGFETNVYLSNAFVTALVRDGRLREAERLFERCGGAERDTVSWNALIAGYLQHSSADVWGFWCRMVREGVRPDAFTFSTVFTGLAEVPSLRNGGQVHAQLVKYGHGSDLCVGNSLADMYLKSQCLIDGRKAFEEMAYKDVVTWTQMASGSLLCGQPKMAFELVEQMRLMGVEPNKFTLVVAFTACANMAALERGRKAHVWRVKHGFDVDECVDNALVDMYSKCGCTDDASKAFCAMGDCRSTVSWTTMITAFAQNGLPQEALSTFDRMVEEGVEPDRITFVCVLYACSQGGLVDEAWRCFSSMKRQHGVDPEEDHYACMVDLLGKAGRVAEAEEVILSMPVEPSSLLWQILLAACQVHGDMERGKRAAERALALDKTDSSTYVLLSNMFANSSDWDGARKVREMMAGSEVAKDPGCSWIAVNG
ncbi:putative pentatricopeptide repeat-containing protein [Acorus gramineus]|uniref:Pentatricopeptide repeat-containing protein n=1 Tax=Acorus gramineus TaxID=55184 RepID=A0AAV8ZX45_ACOGR|nr:putative pentatricopeptide repeat-containing protein [Acorus gramineus]